MGIAFEVYDFAVVGQDNWCAATRSAYETLKDETVEALLAALRSGKPTPKRIVKTLTEEVPPWSRYRPRTWLMASFVRKSGDGYSIEIWYFGCIEDFPSAEPGEVMLLHAEKSLIQIYTLEWRGKTLVVVPARQPHEVVNEKAPAHAVREIPCFLSWGENESRIFDAARIRRRLEAHNYKVHLVRKMTGCHSDFAPTTCATAECDIPQAPADCVHPAVLAATSPGSDCLIGLAHLETFYFGSSSATGEHAAHGVLPALPQPETAEFGISAATIHSPWNDFGASFIFGKEKWIIKIFAETKHSGFDNLRTKRMGEGEKSPMRWEHAIFSMDNAGSALLPLCLLSQTATPGTQP
ncbi:MAG: hypothetical protein JSS20_06765 [Proteobacteria bacterium]|nr:hypothetical protein [Pseudomonadota bacterium]